MVKPAREWTPAELETARSMRASGISWKKVAIRLDRSTDSVRNKLRYTLDDANVAKPVGSEEGSSFTDAGETASLECKLRKRVMSVEDALEAGKVDLTVWRVKDYTINKWEMGYLNIEKEANVIPLWQVKVRLERIHKKCYADSLPLLFEALKKLPAIKTQKRIVRSHRVMFPNLFDAHLGKYAWGMETGTDQDTEILSSIYENAVEDMISLPVGPCERIAFILGNDFFHVNNWLNTTAKGTQVDHDGRFPKVFVAGCKIFTAAVNRFLQIAPVDVIWIPGNHDPETSFALACVIEARFNANKHVTIDYGPSARKYYRYGTNLIGATHGNEEKVEDLPILMASERSMDFAQTSTHEWFTGHLHHKRKFTSRDTTEKMGVRVWTVPGLTGTDTWHHNKAYVNARRAGEAFVFDKTEGYHGHWSVAARGC